MIWDSKNAAHVELKDGDYVVGAIFQDVSGTWNAYADRNKAIAIGSLEHCKERLLDHVHH